MSNFWRALEDLGGLAGVPAVWTRWVGEDFAAVKRAFLQARPEPAASVPCPEECGCAHEVVRHDNGRIVAVCTCDPWNCDNLAVSEADLVEYALNWAKLGRALAGAFDCEAKAGDVGVPGTRQVGAFGGAALPLVLTIQHERFQFRSAVAELGMRLRSGFILLAPTNRWLDAAAQELLGNARAGFFDLESNVRLLPSGALHARKSGGELFSAYVPQPEAAINEAEAVRVFGLMQRLDGGAKARKAPLERVFRLLVLEDRSQEYVARECGCSPGLISLRVEALELRMGRSLAGLKRLATQLGELASVEDTRARAIYRQGLTDDTGDGDEEE